MRAENLEEKTEEYLDLEKPIEDNTREQMIRGLISKALPILNKMETETGFKKLLEEFNPRLFMINTRAQDYLDIKIN